jgi:glycerol-3-phosphate dehydrogenase
MITITGGKLTTWRRMAKLAVDRLVEREAREAARRTHEIPLGQAIAAEELPRVEGVGEESYPALAARYGHGAKEVLALAGQNGDSRRSRVSPGFGKRGELAQPIVPGLPDLLAEVLLAARREQARSIGDVLLRRTRIGLLAARDLVPDRAGEPAAPVRRVAHVLAGELGWDSERVATEIERFAQEARAEGSFAQDVRAEGSFAPGSDAEGSVAPKGVAEGSVAREAHAAGIEPM